jgi:exosortase D (VPLPA-CTERM-specific)
MNTIDCQEIRFKNSSIVWVGVVATSIVFIIYFWDVIQLLFSNWLGTAEYSYGIIMPFVSGFFIWHQRNSLSKYTYTGSWLGFLLVLTGIVIYIVGELSALQIFEEYSIFIVLMGLVWSVVGYSIFKRIWIPIILLFFTIPLPSFLYQGISARLQLLSTHIGVSFIRFWNISVYVEGNVIDLGSMQLQVAEACNGLTYLFPLTSVAFICAYIYHAEFWKRLIIFLSSIPITILMNSFRIGVIGVFVEYFGKSMAEGFLHDFEGWIVFMGCIGIIVIIMWALTQIGHQNKPFNQVFGLSNPELVPVGTVYFNRFLPTQYWFASILLLVATMLSPLHNTRIEQIPVRAEFIDFPMNIEQWSGKRLALDQKYIDSLKFKDYILADYKSNDDLPPVNLYSAYYVSQRKGESIHSPRSCLPGGGWKIENMEEISIGIDKETRNVFKVNRVLIQKGEDRQLVYYWFKQRGRDITNEYLAKWYLFIDGLTRNRTDGALIRLTIYIPYNIDIKDIELKLDRFLRLIYPILDRFIPD